ncbi:MAG: hypothetical protein J6Y05_00105 [Bacteroidales bacterium]|nr:hypothetical protein [Bacteroidales bacterium]
MNTQYKAIATCLLSCALVCAMSSCDDTPDAYEVAGGIPTVDYIRCLSSEIKGYNDDENTVYTNGQLVTSASPQAVLCLIGSNLRSVYEMYFNDKKAILNSSYITDNTLIVSVPSSVPNLVTDKIYMITKSQDTISYDFSVVIPAPQVTAMSCEYAAVGNEVTFTGNYMVNDPNVPLTVSFKDANGNDVEATIKSIAEDYTSCVAIVPEGAAEGAVTMSSIYGSTVSSFRYLDTRGMLFDFDEIVRSNHGWHAQTITTDETAIKGNFLQFGTGDAALAGSGDTWDDSHFHFEYWAGNWADPETYASDDCVRLNDVVDFTDYQNMSVKFELFIPSDYPWSACAMQIIFSGVDLVSMGNAGIKDIYGNTLGGSNNTYFHDDAISLPRALYRPWTSSGSFDTADKWITVTLPIASQFIYFWDGSAASGSLNAESFANLELFVSAGGVVGTDCTPIMKIDNIRVVPNK